MRGWSFLAAVILAVAGCGKSEEPPKPSEPPQQAATAVAFPVPSDAEPITAEAILGDWAVGDSVAKVTADGDKLVCTNEKGMASKCAIDAGKALVAEEWRVHAALLGGGKVLKWSDGSAWTR